MKREITPSDSFVRRFLAHPENSGDLLRDAIPDRLLQHFDLNDIESKLKKLPVIIPFILYHGFRQWRFPLNFTAYFQDSDLFQEYVPDFNSVLYDLNQVDDEKIKGHLIYVAAIKTLKYALRGLKPHLEEILKELVTLPIDERMRAFLTSFFEYILSAGRGVRSEDLGRAIDSAGFKEPREVYMTIAEELTLKGKREGKREGEIAEAQQILICLLDKKFGLDSAARDKILKADNKKKLDRAIGLLLDSKTIDEVLKPLD